MPTFYPFSRFPTELRNRVWELSIQPREVVVTLQKVRCNERRPNKEYWSSPAQVPAILQTSRESRSYLEMFYTKAFSYGTHPRYIWANFNVDTIHTKDQYVERFYVERPLIRRLAVDSVDLDYFFYKCLSTVIEPDALESLMILSEERLQDDWSGWHGMMETIHEAFGARAAMVEVRMIDTTGDEINSGNYRRRGREMRRELASRFPNYYLSDSETSSE